MFGRLNATLSSPPPHPCRDIPPLSLPPDPKFTKIFGTSKKSPYLCTVKTEQQVLHDKTKTILLTIKKYITMYAIAFFTTVILFSASLYIGNKIAESVNNRKSSTNAADYRIGQISKAA
jgi:hypothetical protein